MSRAVLIDFKQDPRCAYMPPITRPPNLLSLSGRLVMVVTREMEVREYPGDSSPPPPASPQGLAHFLLSVFSLQLSFFAIFPNGDHYLYSSGDNSPASSLDN